MGIKQQDHAAALAASMALARECAGLLAGHLREAGTHAGSVQHIVLMQLVAQAQSLFNDVKYLQGAIESDARGGK